MAEGTAGRMEWTSQPWARAPSREPPRPHSLCSREAGDGPAGVGSVATLSGSEASTAPGLPGRGARAHLQMEMPRPQRWRGKAQPHRGGPRSAR